LHDVEICARFVGSDAALEPSEARLVVVAGPSQIVRETKRHKRVDFRRELHGTHQPRGFGDLKPWRQDTDHRVRLTVQRHRPPDDRQIAAETLTPQRVTDDGHVGRAFRLVGDAQSTAHDRLHLQDVEQRAGRSDERNLNRIAGAGQVRRERQILGERLKGL
jgi:hypothetical protein